MIPLTNSRIIQPNTMFILCLGYLLYAYMLDVSINYYRILSWMAGHVPLADQWKGTMCQSTHSLNASFERKGYQYIHSSFIHYVNNNYLFKE